MKRSCERPPILVRLPCLKAPACHSPASDLRQTTTTGTPQTIPQHPLEADSTRIVTQHLGLLTGTVGLTADRVLRLRRRHRVLQAVSFAQYERLVSVIICIVFCVCARPGSRHHGEHRSEQWRRYRLEGLGGGLHLSPGSSP